MAGKKQKVDDAVNFWMTEIRAGERYRKKYGEDARWRDYREYYRGNWMPEVLPVNRIFSYGRSLIPKVYFRSPKVCVSATRPEMVPHAKIVEAIDNWLIKETNLKKTIKRGCLHSYLSGTGPIKLGYDSEYGFNPSLSMDKDTATVSQVSKSEERKIEYNSSIKPGLPWALPALPEDVIVPWGYSSIDTLPWIVHRIMRPLKDIQADSKYAHTNELKGTRRVNLESDSGRKSYLSENKDVLFGELYEIRDASRKEVIVICEDNILYKDADALCINELNWEFIIFNEDPEFFWGIPDTKILEPQQIELNEIKSQTSKHRKIALLKFLYLKGAIKEPEMEKFLSGEVGPAVAVEGDSLANAIIALQPHMPPDLQQASIEVLGDMRESMGFSENQLASFSKKSPHTATEAMQVAQSFESRVDERKDIVGDIAENIIRKWNQYIFSFWTGERVIQVVGPEGGQYWVKYTGDELAGEYALNIDVESGFPVTSTMKQTFADNLMKQYGGDPLIDQVALRKFHLSQYEWFSPGITGLINPAPPQVATDLAQQRQPGPMNAGGGHGNPPGSNQGGGQKGFTPQNPMNFDEFKKNFGGQK